MTIFGYARVSTDGQTLDAQIDALRGAGVADDHIFQEKISGAKVDRAELEKVLKALGPGDVLIVSRLDRLARSTLNLLRTLERITGKGAGFRSLAQPWADTTSPNGRLWVTILAGFAEYERELIMARTSEGRARAKGRGVKFGRKPKLTTHQRQEALERLAAGEGPVDIARSFNVSHSMISRMRP